MRRILLCILLLAGCDTEGGLEREWLFLDGDDVGTTPDDDDDDDDAANDWRADLPDQDTAFSHGEYAVVPDSVGGINRESPWFVPAQDGACVVERPGSANASLVCFDSVGNVTSEGDLNWGEYVAALDGELWYMRVSTLTNANTGAEHEFASVDGLGGGGGYLWAVTGSWRLQQIDGTGTILDNSPLPSLFADELALRLNEGVGVVRTGDAFWLSVGVEGGRRWLLKLDPGLEPLGAWLLTSNDQPLDFWGLAPGGQTLLFSPGSDTIRQLGAE